MARPSGKGELGGSMRSLTERLELAVALLGMEVGAAGRARAGLIPSPTPGPYNPVSITFTATANGDVIGYFGGSGASFENQVGLLVNGVLTSAGYGLDDHSTAIGASFDFGPVNAGDTLVFNLNIVSPP